MGDRGKGRGMEYINMKRGLVKRGEARSRYMARVRGMHRIDEYGAEPGKGKSIDHSLS